MSLCSCHCFCKNLFQHGAFIERYLCLFPCRRPCLPVGGPSRRGSWGQEPTTWWPSLPSIPTVWASPSPQNSEPVSGKSQEDKCDLRESTQKTSLYYHYVQGLYQGSPVYVWTRQGSSLCLWVGIGPRLPCKATDSPTDQEVRRTHTETHTDPWSKTIWPQWLLLWVVVILVGWEAILATKAFCFCGTMEVHFSLCRASMDHPAPDVSLVTWLLDMWITCPLQCSWVMDWWY